LAGFRDAPRQQIHGFKSGLFGRDEPKHYELIFGDIFQWFEGAGASVIVFQQQALSVNFAKQVPANRLIAAP